MKILLSLGISILILLGIIALLISFITLEEVQEYRIAIWILSLISAIASFLILISL